MAATNDPQLIDHDEATTLEMIVGERKTRLRVAKELARKIQRSGRDIENLIDAILAGQMDSKQGKFLFDSAVDDIVNSVRILGN